MASRLRIQYGALHVEYEGSDEFLKTELPALLEHIAKVLPHPPGAQPSSSASGEASVPLGSVRF